MTFDHFHFWGSPAKQISQIVLLYVVALRLSSSRVSAELAGRCAAFMYYCGPPQLLSSQVSQETCKCNATTFSKRGPKNNWNVIKSTVKPFLKNTEQKNISKKVRILAFFKVFLGRSMNFGAVAFKSGMTTTLLFIGFY